MGASVLLVDTSVWIDVFREGSELQLRDVADIEEIVTCMPVVQEVLQGFRDERAFRLARQSMLSFTIVESPLRQEVFLEAANLYRAGRRAGFTIRSGVDCLIAACALRHDLTVLHQNRDFDLLASVSALRARSVTQ